MTKLTKKELLAIAKTMSLTGRHEMSKEQLEAAVEKANNQVGNYVRTAPYKVRVYAVTGFNEEAFNALPPQAKAIFKFMKEKQFHGHGKAIVEAAVNAGYLKTTQPADVLYAFYARKLEDAGVSLL